MPTAKTAARRLSGREGISVAVAAVVAAGDAMWELATARAVRATSVAGELLAVLLQLVELEVPVVLRVVDMPLVVVVDFIKAEASLPYVLLLDVRVGKAEPLANAAAELVLLLELLAPVLVLLVDEPEIAEMLVLRVPVVGVPVTLALLELLL
mmetsp:Transcript_82597/g.198220  ORF Transcript_82597/g.198220 Transcript_82597/m.198220 type:complete len:153 (-) Transcript_82597:707-1165(-)